MLDVRCSMFFFFPPGQKQLSANGASPQLECWNIGIMSSGIMEFDCVTCPDCLTVLPDRADRFFFEIDT
jgi:hypothetical protein